MRDLKRKCREHERPWRDFCVDANLQDSWLERLNGLRVFDLINICEGHPQRSKRAASRYAHIYLKLKKEFLQDVIPAWGDLRPLFIQEVDRLFQEGDTYINFEVKFKLRSGPGRLVYQEELMLKLRAFHLSSNSGLDPNLRAWFDHSVERIETLDAAIRRQLGEEHS